MQSSRVGGSYQKNFKRIAAHRTLFHGHYSHNIDSRYRRVKEKKNQIGVQQTRTCEMRKIRISGLQRQNQYSLRQVRIRRKQTCATTNFRKQFTITDSPRSVRQFIKLSFIRQTFVVFVRCSRSIFCTVFEVREKERQSKKIPSQMHVKLHYGHILVKMKGAAKTWRSTIRKQNDYDVLTKKLIIF